jgi:hypothetical protein
MGTLSPAPEERGVRAENEIVEGGAVEELKEYHIDEKHRADTARYLAYGLAGTLVLTIILQYAATAVFVFMGKADALASIDKLFNILLPVLSSLVSAAATYYFTKEKR